MRIGNKWGIEGEQIVDYLQDSDGTLYILPIEGSLQLPVHPGGH